MKPRSASSMEANHLLAGSFKSQYKRSEMTKKKKSKTILPIPSAARDTSSVAHPRIRMSNLCIGTVFVVLSMLLLSWNESLVMKEVQLFERALESIHTVPNVSVIMPSLQGQLVFVHGPLSVDEDLNDPLCNLTVGASKLKRKVEMFQWIEKQEIREVLRNGEYRRAIVYTYEKSWESELVNSENFNDSGRHRNPGFRLKSQDQVAKTVRIGRYHLSKHLISEISDWSDVPLNRSSIDPIYKLWSSSIYSGLDPFHPAVGDFKISFVYAGKDGQHYSVLARQETGSNGVTYLMPYYSAHGVVMVVRLGELNYKALVERNIQPPSLTWLIRCVCLLFMYIGLFNLSGMFVIIADFIKGDNFTCFPSLGNVTLAIFLCCMLTALQWLHFKPLYGILILFLGILPALLWPFIWKRCCEVGGFCWCEDEDTHELVCLCQNCADSEDE